MRHFHRFATDIDVTPALLEISRAPELWDAYRERKDTDGSPHSQMSDIWVRYRAREELKTPADYAVPHLPVWYPAIHRCPSLRPIVMGVAARVGCVHLGGVLITRIPPGGVIEPHHDRGNWHAEYHNCKVYVPLAANDRCINVCEDERVVMRAGEAWTFDNLKVHSVHNEGQEDRITLIIAMRVD